MRPSTARRAAALCKADLVTEMVVEMTSLQGVMGRDYALYAGETAAGRRGDLRTLPAALRR